MFDKRKENGQQNAVLCPIRFSLYAEDMSQCCTVWQTPDTVLNYLWSMTNAQANCKYASGTIVVEAYATHRIINMEGGFFPLFVRCCSGQQTPRTSLLTICSLRVWTAAIASCKHRWPGRATGSHWNVKFKYHGPSTRFWCWVSLTEQWRWCKQ